MVVLFATAFADLTLLALPPISFAQRNDFRCFALSESDWQAALHASGSGGVNLLPTWHILMYTATVQRRNPMMQRRAKVFLNNRSQAVRLPKEFQFTTDEVFIRKEGEDVILSPRPTDWGPYLDSGPVASDAFMENVEDLSVQEREP